MSLKKRILTEIGALAFMALLALNVHLVNTSNVQQTGFASLSLVELEVQAQSEGEGSIKCIESGDCLGLGDDECLVIQVTSEKLYYFGIDLSTCTPTCLPDGNACCPVYLTQGCCCAR